MGTLYGESLKVAQLSHLSKIAIKLYTHFANSR